MYLVMMLSAIVFAAARMESVLLRLRSIARALLAATERPKAAAVLVKCM